MGDSPTERALASVPTERIKELKAALRAAEARAQAAEAERDESRLLRVELARKLGEAQGRLEASEWPGVVEGWRRRTKVAEERLFVLRVALAIYFFGRKYATARVPDRKAAERIILGEVEPFMDARKADEEGNDDG